MKPHVLVIGAGSIGERHTRCFLKSGECDVSVCEPDATRRDKIKQSYAVRQVYDDLGRVPLAEFPVVVVATPAPFHIPHSLAAARAGCHVLCEKPLSDQPAGIQDLIDTLRTKGRVGATAFTMRSVSAVKRIKQIIDEGKVGTPRLAVANIAQHFPSIRPDYQQIYFAKKSLGGGTLFDMCPHTLNLFEWLLGAERDVHCLLDRLVLEGIETDDVALLNCRHRDGAFGQINTTMFGRVYRYDVTVHGTEATVVWDYTKTEVALYADGRPGSQPVSVETFPAERDDLYIEQARHFLAATRGEKPVACTLEEGWQTLRAVLAARRSAETGRAEPVP